MNIPGKLKVFGHEYSVKTDDKLVLKEGRLGSHCGDVLEIGLCTGIPESQLAETLMHEVLEAIFYHMSLRNKIDHDSLIQISEGLFLVIRDNDLDFRKPFGES